MSDVGVADSPVKAGGAKKKDGPSTGSGRTESGGEGIVRRAVMEGGALKAALGSVIAAVERRNTIPILANVLLEFGATQKLIATATNLDMQVSRSVPAQVSGASWATTVCAHTLKAMADKLPAGCEVTLEIDDAAGRLVVRSGRARFTLPVLPREDFPVMGGGDWPVGQFEMTGAEMLAMINQVEHAVSTEETRYYLNGIFVERADAELLLVATDGHRLAVSARGAPDGSEGLGEGNGGVIIPRAALGVIKALCAEARVDIALALNRFSIEAGEVTLVSKLVDGTFPDWRRVVPGGNDKIITFDPKVMAEAVGRVSVVSSDKTRACRLAADGYKDGRVTLTVVSPENGVATEEISVSYDGAPIEIGFNATYLLAVLGKFSGDSITMALSDGSGPALLRRDGIAQDKHVLMPMRV